MIKMDFMKENVFVLYIIHNQPQHYIISFKILNIQYGTIWSAENDNTRVFMFSILSYHMGYF